MPSVSREFIPKFCKSIEQQIPGIECQCNIKKRVKGNKDDITEVDINLIGSDFDYRTAYVLVKSKFECRINMLLNHCNIDRLTQMEMDIALLNNQLIKTPVSKIGKLMSLKDEIRRLESTYYMETSK